MSEFGLSHFMFGSSLNLDVTNKWYREIRLNHFKFGWVQIVLFILDSDFWLFCQYMFEQIGFEFFFQNLNSFGSALCSPRCSSNISLIHITAQVTANIKLLVLLTERAIGTCLYCTQGHRTRASTKLDCCTWLRWCQDRTRSNMIKSILKVKILCISRASLW